MRVLTAQQGQEDTDEATTPTPEQIIRKLREADRLLAEGQEISEVAKHLEISEATYHRWRAQYGGMKADDARRIKELEGQNARLKRIVADKQLQIQALKELDSGPGQQGSRRAATAHRRNRNRCGRTVMHRESARVSTVTSTCAFPTILHAPSQTRITSPYSSWDLIRKRSEVQVLAGPLHFRWSAGLYLYWPPLYAVHGSGQQRAATGSNRRCLMSCRERGEALSGERSCRGNGPWPIRAVARQRSALRWRQPTP